MMVERKDWQYICIGCGKGIMAGADFVEPCPGCGGTRWLCHWLKGASKPPEAEISGISPRSVSQVKKIICPSLFQQTKTVTAIKKPGPKPLSVKDLVVTLAAQGLSSRGIAAKLNKEGISVSYKTIQRRLQDVLSETTN